MMSLSLVVIAFAVSTVSLFGCHLPSRCLSLWLSLSLSLLPLSLSLVILVDAAADVSPLGCVFCHRSPCLSSCLSQSFVQPLSLLLVVVVVAKMQSLLFVSAVAINAADAVSILGCGCRCCWRSCLSSRLSSSLLQMKPLSLVVVPLLSALSLSFVVVFQAVVSLFGCAISLFRCPCRCCS